MKNLGGTQGLWRKGELGRRGILSFLKEARLMRRQTEEDDGISAALRIFVSSQTLGTRKTSRSTPG